MTIATSHLGTKPALVNLAITVLYEHHQPMIQAGDLSQTQLDEALTARREMMNAMPIDGLALRILEELPPYAFHAV